MHFIYTKCNEFELYKVVAVECVVKDLSADLWVWCAKCSEWIYRTPSCF